jgi:site-specific recombinase XerD
MSRKTFKKIITSPELSEKINPKNKKLVERFLREKDTRSSSGTIKGYESDLEIFLTWNLLHNENKFFIDIKKLEFSDFFSFCVNDLRFGSARFGRLRSCLSSLSNFIEKFYDSDYPAFRNVILKAIDSVPKEPVREKTIVSDEQVNGLLNYLLNEINKPQEACLLALAISSGARVSELLRFNIDLIDSENTAFEGLFIETKKQIKTKGRGKNGKLLYKYILKDVFMPYYEAWLPERDAIMKKNNQDHKSLFIKSDGTPAELATLRSWMPKWESYLGVPVYPHMFRHFLVTRLSILGLSYELITEIFGWSGNGGTGMAKLYDDSTARDKTYKELDVLKNKLGKSNGES